MSVRKKKRKGLVTVNSSFTKELELSAAMTEELYITNARALISPQYSFYTCLSPSNL